MVRSLSQRPSKVRDANRNEQPPEKTLLTDFEFESLLLQVQLNSFDKTISVLQITKKPEIQRSTNWSFIVLIPNCSVSVLIAAVSL